MTPLDTVKLRAIIERMDRMQIRYHDFRDRVGYATDTQTLVAEVRKILAMPARRHNANRKHTDNCGRTGPVTVKMACCKINCGCWCHVEVV